MPDLRKTVPRTERFIARARRSHTYVLQEPSSKWSRGHFCQFINSVLDAANKRAVLQVAPYNGSHQRRLQKTYQFSGLKKTKLQEHLFYCPEPCLRPCFPYSFAVLVLGPQLGPLPRAATLIDPSLSLLENETKWGTKKNQRWSWVKVNEIILHQRNNLMLFH